MAFHFQRRANVLAALLIGSCLIFTVAALPAQAQDWIDPLTLPGARDLGSDYFLESLTRDEVARQREDLIDGYIAFYDALYQKYETRNMIFSIPEICDRANQIGVLASNLHLVEVSASYEDYLAARKVSLALYAAVTGEAEIFRQALPGGTTIADIFEARYGLDQVWRQAYNPDNWRDIYYPALEFFHALLGAAACQDDLSNYEFLKGYIATNGWPSYLVEGEDIERAAWSILKSNQYENDVIEGLISGLKDEAESGQILSQHYAEIVDRQRTFTGGVQIYGTWTVCNLQGIPELHQVENREDLDNIRATIGLGPVEDYIAGLPVPCREDIKTQS